MLAILHFFLLLLPILDAVANPVPDPDGNAPHLEARVAANNLVKISSASDFCMIVPKNKNTAIGASERPGGTTTYCSRPTSSKQGKLAPNFWKNVAYKKGKGKGAWVQLTGCINTKTLDRLQRSDGGGQYDSSGGAGGRGNPVDSKCNGYKHYVELIEPDVNRACIRCCNSYSDCPLHQDTAGCPSVIPGNYFGCR